MTETTIKLREGSKMAARYGLSPDMIMTGQLREMGRGHHITLRGHEFQFTTAWLGTINLDGADFEVMEAED
ncbi:MAG: hypothetical protein V3W44_02140 [Dehalococcoidales bacterium]